MPYPEELVQPMRAELVNHGVEELKTADAVDTYLSQKDQTTLVVVNSVCGCAAGGARPAIGIALQNEKRPGRAATVFAGQDVEAVHKAREFFGEIPPSSPCFALIKNGEVVHFTPRHMIEGRDPNSIAFDLVQAFEEHC